MGHEKRRPKKGQDIYFMIDYDDMIKGQERRRSDSDDSVGKA